MKKYLADILTLARFIIAVTLIILGVFGGDRGVAFLLFILGELTDALDGTCATKWPFPKNKIPKYRRYSSKYDIVADMLLGIGMALFFINQVDLVAGLIICGGYSLLAFITDIIFYGKVIGHPDDFKSWSLSAHNFKLAKTLILARRRLYVTLIAVVSVWTLYASPWNIVVKIVITIILAIASVFFWFFLAQRRHNITRNAVDIEKKLSK